MVVAAAAEVSAATARVATTAAEVITAAVMDVVMLTVMTGALPGVAVMGGIERGERVG